MESSPRRRPRAGAVFRAAPSRYPHISVAYTSDGAEDVDAGPQEGAEVRAAPAPVLLGRAYVTLTSRSQ
ncbi:hypothetical protein [Streptomyces sp. NPDC001604]|uniref:hypothetical protein n=1 Tax=Streptomyces sp. NPDC001604 TaxID=3364593 RepID=UPI003688220C